MPRNARTHAGANSILPSDPENLRDSIGKVRGYVSRYIGNKHKRRGVHIEPVGHYKHYPEQDLLDHDFHDYEYDVGNGGFDGGGDGGGE